MMVNTLRMGRSRVICRMGEVCETFALAGRPILHWMGEKVFCKGDLGGGLESLVEGFADE